MNATENKRRPSITSIFVLLVILLFATGSGWNHYQTNKKISLLLIENSTLQNNYQLEISTLEGITEKAQAELMEQRKLISEMQSKVGSIENIDQQDRDYWLILQIEYFLNLADSELFLGRNNERANDLIKQAKTSALGLSEQNEGLLIRLASLIESVDLFVDENRMDDITAIIDQIEDSLIEDVDVPLLPTSDTNASFTIDGFREWFERIFKNFENNWSNIILVKSKSNLDITKLSNEEKRVIQSLIILNIDLIRLALQSGNETRYLAAVLALEDKLIRYYQSTFSANEMLSENIALLKKHRMHPTEIGMKDTLRIVEEMKNQ
ncbi:MAG TPA: hypothetical protein QF857_04890 [Gammaproteobacteria bacterium]|nr:hypothetical protein [Gammaproteobacteria bacterium]